MGFRSEMEVNKDSATPNQVETTQAPTPAKEPAASPEPTEQPDQEASPGQSAEGSEEGQDEAAKAAEAQKPAYQARSKFKVMDTEYDVPEWLKPLMKDENSEKEVMTLLNKAFGLDHVRPKLTETQKERDTYKQKATVLETSINKARATYQRGDIDMFLQQLSIPQERMLQWALDKVNYSQLPPEQQRQIDVATEAQRRAIEAEEQAHEAQGSLQEQNRSTKALMLDQGLTRPDVQTFAEAFDSKLGKPGAFRSEVIAAGEIAWIQSDGKVNLTPEQAIEQTLAKYKGFMTQSAPAPTPTPQPGAAGAGQGQTGTQAQGDSKRVVQPQTSNAAIIPNVQGRTSSPMKSKPRSVDDLRKLSKAAQAAQ